MASTEPVPRCPFCMADGPRPRFRHGVYTIFACRACGGGFASPRPHPAELGTVYDAKYAETYASGAMNTIDFSMRRFHDLESSLRRYFPAVLEGQRKRVLDVGCASGGLMSEFARRGWRAEGAEVSQELAAAARSKGLTVHVGDFLRLDLEEGVHDLITMFHVIEHLDDPGKVVQKCHALLRAGGVLVMETPNWRGIGALLRGSRWSHLIPPEHLNYFGPAALSSLVLRAGFSTARAVTITPQVIEAVEGTPRLVRHTVRGVYQLATLLAIGTTLQVFAVKNNQSQDREGRHTP